MQYVTQQSRSRRRSNALGVRVPIHRDERSPGIVDYLTPRAREAATDFYKRSTNSHEITRTFFVLLRCEFLDCIVAESAQDSGDRDRPTGYRLVILTSLDPTCLLILVKGGELNRQLAIANPLRGFFIAGFCLGDPEG